MTNGAPADPNPSLLAKTPLPLGQVLISQPLGCIWTPALVGRLSWWFRALKAAPICPSVPWEPSLRLTGALGWFGNPWNFCCPGDRTQRARLICATNARGNYWRQISFHHCISFSLSSLEDLRRKEPSSGEPGGIPTLCPASHSSLAAVSPAMPAPTTTTCAG